MTLYHDESVLSCLACGGSITRAVDPVTGNESLAWSCACVSVPQDANPLPSEEVVA